MPDEGAIGVEKVYSGGEVRERPFSESSTLFSLLARNAVNHPQRVAVREKDQGIWREYTWREYLHSTVACAAGLESLGFGPQDSLLTLGDPRPEIYFGMLGAGILKGYPAPVYHHHGLVRDALGRKLSKSDAATSLRSLREAGWSRSDVIEKLGLEDLQ